MNTKLYKYFVYIPNIDSLVDPATYYIPARRPLAVTSIGNDVYLAHHINDTSALELNTLAIEKLDLNASFGDSTWIIVSGGSGIRHNVNQSIGDVVIMDIVPYNAEKVAFVTNFSSYQQSWQIQLGAKSLASNTVNFGDVHTVVALAEDLGTSGQYKREMEIEPTMADIKLFPNPTKGSVNITCSEPMIECSISNAAGNLIAAIPGYNERILTMETQNLSAGLYVVLVKTETKVYVQKLLVQK